MVFMQLKMTNRIALKSQQCTTMLALLTIGLVGTGTVGCCTPMSMGPGCVQHCQDCDGTAGRPIPYAPFQNVKRQLTCGGGGCGEVYVGEWISTPPDCHDPCCGDQFVGGAVKSQPFCVSSGAFRWTPGSLISRLQGYGRFNDGGCCDSCSDGYFEDHVESPVYHSSVPAAGSGCSTCSSSPRGSMGNTTHYAAARGRVSQPTTPSTRMASRPR